MPWNLGICKKNFCFHKKNIAKTFAKNIDFPESFREKMCKIVRSAAWTVFQFLPKVYLFSRKFEMRPQSCFAIPPEFLPRRVIPRRRYTRNRKPGEASPESEVIPRICHSGGATPIVLPGRSMLPRKCYTALIKKKKKFLIYKEIQMGSGAKSYMRKAS